MPRRRRRRRRDRDRDENVLLLREIDRTLAGTFAVLVMMPLTIVGIGGGIAVTERFPSLHGWETLVAALGGVIAGAIGFPLGWALYFIIPRPGRIALQLLAMFTFRSPKKDEWYHKRKKSLGQSIRELMALRREMEAAESPRQQKNRRKATDSDADGE